MNGSTSLPRIPASLPPHVSASPPLRVSLSSSLLWAVYIALLATLLPHTAWAFGQFEPPAWRWLGWIAAGAFEGAIAAFTWRLKVAIETGPRQRSPWRRWRTRYLNVYSAGLLLAIAISGAANWAHAVQFGSEFRVFGLYRVSPLAYSLAFGAILPFCSLLFARILADVVDADSTTDPEIATLRTDLAEARRTIAEQKRDLLAAQAAAAAAEQRFAAAGDLFVRLLADSKRERILAAFAQWPGLPYSALAIIAGSSPSYVCEVLSDRVTILEDK